ncbi:MAG TPA: hypothetical protein VF614_07230 [Chthoniobacteraceae bacterium]|jgi:hypothetical protein
MNRLFHIAPVRGEAWPYIVTIGLFTFAAVELKKWLRFRKPDPVVPVLPAKTLEQLCAR